MNCEYNLKLCTSENMGKFSINFDKKLLKSLKDDPESGVHLIKNKTHLAIHPFQLNEFNSSLKEILNRGIAKYNQSLGGISLGYQNLKLESDLGVINSDSCFIHFDIQAEYFVFKPEIGMELKGIATKKSKDHVGCLVYNTFNVSLPRHECKEEWIGGTVQSGHEIKFRITFMDLESRLPYIRGKLLKILNADLVTNPKQQQNKRIKFNEDGEEEEKQHKKKKKKERSREEIIQERKIDQISIEENKKKKKKSKKKKSQDESLESLNLGDIFNFDSSVLNKSSQMADGEDVVQKISQSSGHKIDVSNIEVEFDSDMERIMNEPKSKKRKRKSESESSKKKKDE